MKITRAYTIDIETKEILDRKRNKSQFVCMAVKKYQKGQRGFDLSDVKTGMMLNSLLSREDISASLKALIEIELWG